MTTSINDQPSDQANDHANSPPLYDAHSHPTDTMSSISNLRTMTVTALTIVSTRAEDQDLVASVAESHGLTSSKDPLTPIDPSPTRVIPAFGQHPWFSHTLHGDHNRSNTTPLTISEKLTHYRTVLTPPPPDQILNHLPDPQPLSAFITATRQRLQHFPLALVGEIGLDRAFRLPEAWAPGQESPDPSVTPGGREGRRLSAYKVAQEHQVKVLTAQLALAGEMGRAVSLHGVQAHGVLFEVLRGTWMGFELEVLSKTELKRRRSVPNAHASPPSPSSANSPSPQPQHPPLPYPPRACLHSYSGPPELLPQYLHPSVPIKFYFSFSIVVNFSAPTSSQTRSRDLMSSEKRSPGHLLAEDKLPSSVQRTIEVIRRLPADRILTESDMHAAGPEMEQKLREVVGRVCEIRGWSEMEGRRVLAENWRAFVFG